MASTVDSSDRSALQAHSNRSNNPAPNLTRKPSWIGPLHARHNTPDKANMTQKCRLTYSHAGLQPPVYVAGSLGETQWEPIEMKHTAKDDGELEFWHEMDLEEGEYQYKFRLGPGDWWVLDEGMPIVDDGAGNRNNMLVVEPKSEEKAAGHGVGAVHHEAHVEPHSSVPEPAVDEGTLSKHDSHVLLAQEKAEPQPKQEMAPLLSHEVTNAEPAIGTNRDGVPLLKHEYLSMGQNDDALDDEYEDDDDFEEEDKAPLFRHESMVSSPVAHSTNKSLQSSSSHSSFLDDDHLNLADPSLERFPSDTAGIMAHIHRAESRLPEDPTTVDGNPPSPSLARSAGFDFPISPTFDASPSLTKQLSNDGVANLDAILEDVEPPQDTSTGVMPSTAALWSASDKGSEKRPASPKLSLSQQQENVTRGPPTPPMTPIIDEDFSEEQQPLPTSQSPRQRKDNITDNITTSSGQTTPPSLSSTSNTADEQQKATVLSNFWDWVSGVFGSRAGASGVAVAVGIAAALYAVVGRAAERV